MVGLILGVSLFFFIFYCYLIIISCDKKINQYYQKSKVIKCLISVKSLIF